MAAETLESRGTTRDGTLIALRPIRAEDEPLLQDLFAHLNQEDVRLRFFAPIRQLSRTLADRLSHLDYGREMALIAQHDRVILGAASYFAELGTRSAEFAPDGELESGSLQRRVRPTPASCCWFSTRVPGGGARFSP